MTDWQDWEVPLAGSIDNHKDRKQVIPGNFLSIKEAEFSEDGAVSTRNGRQSLNSNIFTLTSELEVPYGVAGYRNTEVAFAGSYAYARSDSASAWVRVGKNGIIDSKSTILNNNGRNISYPSAAYAGGKILYTYIAASSGSFPTIQTRITLVDAESGTIIIDDRLVAATRGAFAPSVAPFAKSTRTIAVGSIFVFAVMDSAGQIHLYKLDPSVSGMPVADISATTGTTTDMNTVTDAYDLVAISATEFMFSYRNTANQIATGRFNLTGRIGSYATVAAGVSGRLGIAWDSIQSRLLVAFSIAGTAINGIVYNLALTVNVPSTLISTAVSDVSINQVCAIWDGISGKFTVFFDRFDASSLPTPTFDVIATSRYIDLNYSGGAFTTVGSTVIARGLSLGSKAYMASGNIYISLESFGSYIVNAAIFPSALTTGGAFLVKMDPTLPQMPAANSSSAAIITRVLSGFRAGTYSATAQSFDGSVGDVAFYSDGSGRAAIPTYRTSRIDVNTLSLYSTLYSTKSVKNTVSQTIGDSLYTCSSMLYKFDGHEYTEQGFHYQPIIAIAQQITGGATLPNGTYQLAVVYEYLDKNGSFTRSSPTFTSIVVSGGNNSIVVQSRTVPTQKAVYSIVVYLSQANLTTLYRVSVFDVPQSQSNTFVNITLTSPPTTAEARIYTAGGVIQNTPLPSPDMICAHKNRLYALVNGRDIWFSKPTTVGEDLGMSSVQSFPLSIAGGTPISLGSMDDNLIIFAEQSAYALGGEGPNILGVGSFIGPQQILTDSGCDPRSPASVVKYRDGLIFRGPKHITLLGRDFSAREFREVEDISSVPITAATLFASKNEIRFSRYPSTAALYDYSTNRWSEYLYATVGSAVVGGTYIDIVDKVLGLSSTVSKETSEYRDNLTASGGSIVGINTEVVTGWINLAGIQGYQRIRRFSYEADNVDQMVVGIYYDYDDTLAETFTQASPVVGPMIRRYRLSRQRCRAIKFSFLMIRSSTVSPAVLSSLRLELGTIKGIYRRDG